MLKRWERGVAGFIVGAGLGLIVLPWLMQHAFAPAVLEAPTYVRADFSIVDAVTGQPLEADITIRRERADRMLIGPEMFYSGHHIMLEVPVDGYRTWLLVEKLGFKDWERELGRDTLTMLSGLIRLVPLSERTPLPFPQGQEYPMVTDQQAITSGGRACVQLIEAADVLLAGELEPDSKRTLEQGSRSAWSRCGLW